MAYYVAYYVPVHDTAIMHKPDAQKNFSNVKAGPRLRKARWKICDENDDGTRVRIEIQDGNIGKRENAQQQNDRM